MSLFEELKRRNVFRVAAAYLITSWVLLQVADLVLQNIHAPDWVIQVFMLALGLGFPLAMIFAWAYELTPEGLKKEKDVDRSKSITPQTGRKLDFVIIGVLAVAVLFLLVDRFAASPDTSGQSASARPEPAEASMAATQEDVATQAIKKPKEKSVAVLPFVNMSSDPEQEYFSDGISEEILNALARVRDLKVAGRTSSFAFKGQNQDLRKIGETLGVENILEGSVRKSGNKVRITAQLIQVDDGFHLWSDTYDRELDDVFAIQDEIAGAILQQLKAHLLENEQTALASARTNSEAYDLYLLAKQRIYERTRPTIEAAAETLDRAIAIDPEYAPAYAQRGITALLLSETQYGTLSKEQSQTQGKLYLDQALRLDPQQPEALAGLGLYYINIPGRTTEAIEPLEKALDLNPNLINASNWLQTAYSNAGRLTESQRILEDLIERDPLYRPGIANLNGVFVSRGELDKAKAMVEKIRPFMPNDPFLYRIEANIQYAEGHVAKGMMLMEKALEIQPDNFPNVTLFAEGLHLTAQWERLIEGNDRRHRVIGLQALGRTEEATILATQLADSGEDVGILIGLLANSGKPEQAIRFFEERWPSLEAYERDYPPLGSGSIGTILDIAYAYGSLGNQERFDEAMSRARASLDSLDELGFRNPGLEFINGVYYAMAGDREQALALISSAVGRGELNGTRLSDGWAGLKVLEGDPEYEGIQARMMQHLNAERAELGLGPLST